MTTTSDIAPIGRSGFAGHKRRGARLAILAICAALGACGKSADPQTEARLAALEAKVDAAEKRSQQALSMAATGGSAPPPAEAGGPDNYGEPVDGGVTDGSADSAIYENTIEAPPPPMIAGN
ncbi:hypothetical protein [Novosphingobium sp. B1]|uniref:hypothetical protein n=1 Tax=Novosphingobium sp. B1 TaxID=1938756 RepID=UPI0009D8A4D0|nr:hypothetical protein [Novosphingobium sp. B1]SMC30566.1 hypothetical protein SAMN06272759_101117 [Novosphingobium sp. B1]